MQTQFKVRPWFTGPATAPAATYDEAASMLPPDASEVADIGIEARDLVSVDTGNPSVPFVGRVKCVGPHGAWYIVRQGSCLYKTQPGQTVTLLMKAAAVDVQAEKIRRKTATAHSAEAERTVVPASWQ